MGWSFCGKNHYTGEEMGYGVEGVCAHPECSKVIDHGLARLCGDMHADGQSCNRYFCGRHLSVSPQRCDVCYPPECEVCGGWGFSQREEDPPTREGCLACGGTGSASKA